MADRYVQMNLQALLAGLTGDRNRLWEMAYTLSPDHVPPDLPLEKAWLDTLWVIQNNGGIPTKENVLM